MIPRRNYWPPRDRYTVNREATKLNFSIIRKKALNQLRKIIPESVIRFFIPCTQPGNEIAVDPLLRSAIKHLMAHIFSPIGVENYSVRCEDPRFLPLRDFLLVGGAALIVDALMERTNRAILQETIRPLNSKSHGDRNGPCASLSSYDDCMIEHSGREWKSFPLACLVAKNLRYDPLLPLLISLVSFLRLWCGSIFAKFSFSSVSSSMIRSFSYKKSAKISHPMLLFFVFIQSFTLAKFNFSPLLD